MAGPGTNLHDAIAAWTGQAPDMSCSCKQWIKKMDLGGPEWCRKHFEEIVAHLMREAKKRLGQWKAVPVDVNGNLLQSIRNAAFRGVFMVPGAGVVLQVFVRNMVTNAIEKTERGE